MDIENTINLNNNLNQKTNLEKEQNNFLNSMLGKAINSGIDVGLRAILPDFIEDQIINVKNGLLDYGLNNGISKTIEGAINIGKNALGIITKGFKNTIEMQTAIKSGGIIGGLSKALESAVSESERKGAISPDVSNILKKGKTTILNNVENNIDKNLENQNEIYTNLEKYISNWKNSFQMQDFKAMEKQYKNIKKELKELLPIEKTLSEARTIENLHTLIKTNGQDFNLSETEKELLEKLS